jgi:Na+/H+ antiporter NhaD/arsenite permease-like protein
MGASEEDRQRVMNYNEWDALTDLRLLRQSLFVLALVLAGFVVGHGFGLQPASVAMSGAALLLLLDNLPRSTDEQSRAIQSVFAELEWVTLFFFVGLFVVVHGVESTGLLTTLAQSILQLTGGDPLATSATILWGSAVASALLDNIPFVAATIPLIKSMAPAFGGPEGLMPLWWSLALGSCLGGNGSLIGASANVIVAGFAERSGQPISFVRFALGAFPLMLLSIVVCNVYIYLRYY